MEKEGIKHIQTADWDKVYNLIEYIVQFLRNARGIALSSRSESFEGSLNIILEIELSGYRLIDGQIVPITNEHEIQSIQESVASSLSHGLTGVGEHINTALRHLGKEPDYRNSIKESISAVESICKQLTDGNPVGWIRH
ncbi:MAG: hypothetical protein HY894_06110 [Deltaproteobacteria bacterium]|nr:hypothetical protein [Deltaproteobacteria bacterium]